MSKKYKFEFNIDRSKWGAGYLNDGSRMCAMGFLGKAIGIPSKSLKDHGFPANTSKKFHKKWAALGLMECNANKLLMDSEIAFDIAECNDEIDDRRADNKQIEKNLKRLFRKLDIKVNFINKFSNQKDEKY